MDFKTLEAFLEKITAWRIPGCDLAVTYRGETVFRKKSGLRDVEAGVPVDGTEIYNLFSISKVYTCTAMTQLYEKGLFLLTDPVSEYLPEFGDMSVLHRRLDGYEYLEKARVPMRIVDLYTMSAGLSYNMDTPPIREAIGAGQTSTRDLVRAIAKSPLLFEPGQRWNYSLCHDVLGALIEVLSGQRFGDYLKEHIFEPLGMKDSGFVLSPEQQKRLAPLYRYNDDTGRPEGGQPNSFRLSPDYESGGAGLYSTVDDCIRFATAMANGGRAPDGTVILSRAAIDLMRTNQLTDAARQADIATWSQLAGYGYGLGVRTMLWPGKGGCLSGPGEYGWSGAAGALMVIDPERQLGLYYGQHMLNNQECYVHPRLKNILYSSLER